MAKEKNRTELTFFVTEEELRMIRDRMEGIGIRNMSAYLRKMAIDGYILKLNLPEIHEMISLLRNMSNNLNQIARRVNATGYLYENELREIQQQQQVLWERLNAVLHRLNKLT